MTRDTYLFADESVIPRPGPKGEITDAELIALAVAQASMGVPSDRQFLGLVAKVLPGWFPHLPRQSQYIRRLRRLAPSLAAVQLRIAELIATHELVIVLLINHHLRKSGAATGPTSRLARSSPLAATSSAFERPRTAAAMSVSLCLAQMNIEPLKRTRSAAMH